MQKRGTPKTLQEACRNGLEQYYTLNAVDNGTMDLHLALHIKDFLSQHFTVEMLRATDLKANELSDLFSRITKGLE